MTAQPSSRATSQPQVESGDRKPGRHARPAALPVRPIPDMVRDRSLERISAADWALADAHTRLRSAGADSDIVRAAFTIARESLRDARDLVREARRELALVTYEMEQERRASRAAARYPHSASPVVPDQPGLDLCPDPRSARTPAEFMDVLRQYRVWAGRPSYRAMRDQCDQRFATSTIHAALKKDELPGLPLVQCIVTACGGSDAHQQTFASAWRRLVMSAQDGLADDR